MTNSLVLPSDEELSCWLAFDQLNCKGFGGQKLKAMYEHFDSLIQAWNANRHELMPVPGLPRDVVDRLIEARKSVEPERLLEQCRTAGIHVYPLCHPAYPSLLKEIPDPPLILYVNGTIDLDQMLSTVGIVGTRQPTAYGQKYAKDISRNLAASGVTVVSGMAIGIDSFAHRGAIEGGGKTVAVLGCGPDQCYPSSNKPLFQMLTRGDHGAVVSEFFPGTPPETWRFPSRNRIISGLSQAVAVIEAGQNSGSLITARQALDQNREVFALPGRVDSPASIGTNDLIARSMAHVLRSHKDILDEMNWVVSPSAEKATETIVELYGREKEVYDLLSHDPIHFDVLVERTGMATGELSATLTMLELAGLATRLPGDFYSRN